MGWVLPVGRLRRLSLDWVVAKRWLRRLSLG